MKWRKNTRVLEKETLGVLGKEKQRKRPDPEEDDRWVGEEINNISISGMNVNSTTKRIFGKTRLSSSLDKLEARLSRVRASIRREAALVKNINISTSNSSTLNYHLDDVHHVPRGRAYRNPNVFHRSYLEMEKRMKIYVYEEGDVPIFHGGPSRSIYGTEGRFIYEMEKGTLFRTTDPNRAIVYFMPFSVVRMVRYISRNHKAMGRVIKDYINLISRTYPFWNRTLGPDHFMLSCHDL
ncbi:probable glycosyltransferase At5g03795, partial [Morus notabilis]|uniref:probable glycosyltransferase At5g03795 n=1 Tax=Morus notabilis TaxID=981085 RepID=UPI000CECEF98